MSSCVRAEDCDQDDDQGGSKAICAHVSRFELDRAAGVLLGSAAGDALGAGYEFDQVGPADPVMTGGGYFGWEPGEWTDDTEMAVCVAEEAAKGLLDPVAVGSRFLDWFNGGPRDVGNQTRAVLSTGSSPMLLRDQAAAYFRAHPHNAAGNGSLMRTGPLVLAAPGDDSKLGELARSVSELTHADPLPVTPAFSGAWASTARSARTASTAARDGLALLPEDRREFWAAAIEEATTRPPSSFHPQRVCRDGFPGGAGVGPADACS